ncbi:MAG TPA: hypothetical protein VLJ42_04900 [Solirubrobacteraceae bacterium]|nr:hypothetical protein [Solirubrobacteraceae bacterium]
MSKFAAFAAVSIMAIGVAACGSSSSTTSTASKTPEVNPAGDIPDNQAYVRYASPDGRYSIKVPEGWSQTAAGGAVIFTDKLNAVRIETVSASAPLTARDARQTELSKLAASVKGFQQAKVNIVGRRAGTAVRIAYLATAKPNPVTGKTGQDAVERYVFFHNGRDVTLTLSGPKGADNVDPWRIITDSVQWPR